MAGDQDSGTRTEALVLRRIPYGESDLVVHFATPAAGRVACFARGARRSRRRFPSGLPTFALMEIRLGASRKAEGLRPLLEGVVVRPNLGVAACLTRFAAGSLLLEIARDTLPEDHPEPAAFETLDNYLRSIDEAPFSFDGLLAAEMRLLALLGLAPLVARCVVCDRDAPAGKAAFFDPRRGGIVCRRCGGAPLTIPGPVREAMLAAVSPQPGPGAPAAAEPGPPGPWRSAHDALLAFLEYHLGRRFRSAHLLEEALGREAPG